MSVRKKAGSLSLKAIYFSLRDAISFRQLDRDPGNRDVTRGDYSSGGEASPRIDRALQLSTVWSCVRLISGTISTLPLFVYERTVTNGRDTRKVARDHPLYYLLHDSPNADMTAVEFWEAIVVGLCTWGNAYVLKTRSAGRLVALDPLNPALMTVRRTLDGAITYIYADPRGQREYTEAEIWHVKGFGSDGLMGLSPIGVGWRSIYSASNVESAASATFGGNMRPTGVVSVAAILTPDQRRQMQQVITEGVFGNAEMGRQYLLEGGAQYKQLSINPVDAQMAEALGRSVEDLCRWYQVPPSMIGHGTAVSNWGTGREQINLGFKQYVLDQYTTRIEQSINKHLLTPAERKRFYAEFSFEGLLRTDSTARAAFYKSGLFDGWMNVDEVRAYENLPPVPGGDIYRVQAAMIPLTQLGKVPQGTQNGTIQQDPQGNDNELPDQSRPA